MRTRTHRAAAFVGTAALAVGLLTGTAGSAQAIPVAPPTDVVGFGGTNSYSVGWGPADGDAASYDVNLYAASDTTATRSLKFANVPPAPYGGYTGHDFTGLTAGTKYFATVTTVDFDNNRSAAVRADIDQAYAAPGKVRNLKATPGNGKITVTWKTPVVNAATGPMSGYILVYTGAQQTFEVSGSATRAVLKGLKNGKKYTVTIYPFAGGEGPASQVKATPLGRPAKPSKLRVTFKSGGKAKLSWKAPKSTKAAPVTGYEISVNGTKVKAVKGKKATTATVKGLKKGKKYTFTVRASNAAATSKALSSKKLKRP